MTMEAGTKIATSTVDALKAQPLALALVVVNILFLIAAGLFVVYIGGAIRAERVEHSAALKAVIERCGPTKPAS
jgi:hypothetical protein